MSGAFSYNMHIDPKPTAFEASFPVLHQLSAVIERGKGSIYTDTPNHFCIYLIKRLHSAFSKLSASSFPPFPGETVIFDKKLVPGKRSLYVKKNLKLH